MAEDRGRPAGQPGRRRLRRNLIESVLPGFREIPALEVIDKVRLQSVGAAVVAAFAVLAVVLLYGLIPGHVSLSTEPYFILVGGAVVVTAVAGLLPWTAYARRGVILPIVYCWALLNCGLISAGVALSGGGSSDLYLAYLVLCVFQAGVSFPRQARIMLTLTLIGSYVLALISTGWHIGAADVVLRIGMIVATAALADVLASKLTSELVFHGEAATLSERRAELWSRVAGLGRALDTLDEDAMLAWAVEALGHLGYEASNVCIFTDGGETYQVTHPRGLPEGYAGGSPRPSNKGMPGLVRRDRRTVIVDEYRLMPDVVPELREEGFRTVVATPIWVDSTLAGALVGGTREKRAVGPEEVAAFELLAAHVGTGIARARRLDHERSDTGQLSSMIESAAGPMAIFDTSMRVLVANSQFRTVLGYEPAQLRGRSLESLLAEESRHLARELRQRASTDPQSIGVGFVVEAKGLHADGGWVPIELTFSCLDTQEGIALGAMVRDVTERREYERRLAHQASHDDLTGLPNRTLFLDRLADALEHGPAVGPAVAVCFLDIDHFKYLNDSRGHTVGDELLVEVARRISETARSADIVARFGGDEFAVLIHGLSNRQGAVAYAWRLLSAFDRPFTLQGTAAHMSASAGIAFGARGDDPHDLLRDADAAMYHAKQRGRSRVELFDETLTTRALERVEMEAGLHRALVASDLSLVYQPYVELNSGLVHGVEALMRWTTSGLEEIPPVAFIPVAEESGLINQLGRFALNTACRQASSWRSSMATGTDFAVSVNVSNRQLEHDHLVADVASTLEESALEPHCLVLEITESFFMSDLHAAVRRLHALRQLGVRIAIDDFGTGFSSLNSLSRLPVDVVKIDKSFIDGLGTRYDSVIGAVVDVAGAFDLTVVAEGVERQEQVDRLLELGCHMGQGFLLGRPLAAELIEPSLVPAESTPLP